MKIVSGSKSEDKKQILERDNLSYRKKVTAVIINESKNYLIVQLSSYDDTDWNFPGGGVESNESEEDALIRELQEELGTDKFKIIKKSGIKNRYDWPDHVIAKRLKDTGQTFLGQESTFFLVKYLGEKKDINPDPNEIKKIKWVTYKDIKNLFNFPNQWKVAEEVIKDLSK